MPTEYDAIVIGAEPVGYDAAAEASRRGLRVLMVTGADVPCSGLLGVGHLQRVIAQYSFVERVLELRSQSGRRRPFLLAEIARHVRAVEVSWASHLRGRLELAGVQIVDGTARFLAPDRVAVDGVGSWTAPIITIATGQRPRRPERFSFDTTTVFDCESILERESLPRDLLIVGAEKLGCELACIFAALRVRVTVVERRRRFLRHVDRELLELLHQRMQEAGIELVLDEELADITIHGGSGERYATVKLGSGRTETCDAVLVAAGFDPNVEDLGIERLGIATDPRGFIETDEYHQTSRAGIYAVGHVATGSLAVQSASRDGGEAIRHALGLASELSSEAPMSIYSIPEISMIGLTEEMCLRLDLSCEVGVGRYQDVAWAPPGAEKEGLLKLVVGREDRRLLGVHVIGTRATELANLGALFLSSESVVDEVARARFEWGSVCEAYCQAATDAIDRLDGPHRIAGHGPGSKLCSLFS